jgi:hypothetical protein
LPRSLGSAGARVKRYLAAGGWHRFRTPARRKLLDGEAAWLHERLRQHRGNADVVRQELAAEKGIVASLRTVERALEPVSGRAACRGARNRALRDGARPPAADRLRGASGRDRRRQSEGVPVRCDAGLRAALRDREAMLRIDVRAFRHERQESWLDGLESAFLAFGGVPEEVLVDNARALVTAHDIETRTVVFNARLLAFARHWGLRPKACAPYRARTKGKTERGVGYVKRNAIAGRSFASWEALEGHLARWEREIANARVHATTGETPAERFAQAEAAALRPLAGRPPFRTCRTLERRVKNDCVVEVDGNAYSVPWRLIGETVEVTVAGGPGTGQVRVRHGTREVAVHAIAAGKRQRVIDAAHLEGVAGAPGSSGGRPSQAAAAPPGEMRAPPPPSLLRPLAEYEAAVGGGF